MNCMSRRDESDKIQFEGFELQSNNPPYSMLTTLSEVLIIEKDWSARYQGNFVDYDTDIIQTRFYEGTCVKGGQL